MSNDFRDSKVELRTQPTTNPVDLTEINRAYHHSITQRFAQAVREKMDELADTIGEAEQATPPLNAPPDAYEYKYLTVPGQWSRIYATRAEAEAHAQDHPTSPLLQRTRCGAWRPARNPDAEEQELLAFLDSEIKARRTLAESFLKANYITEATQASAIASRLINKLNLRAQHIKIVETTIEAMSRDAEELKSVVKKNAMEMSELRQQLAKARSYSRKVRG